MVGSMPLYRCAGSRVFHVVSAQFPPMPDADDDVDDVDDGVEFHA
jgi:hypothetical protein